MLKYQWESKSNVNSEENRTYARGRRKPWCNTVLLTIFTDFLLGAMNFILWVASFRTQKHKPL